MFAQHTFTCTCGKIECRNAMLQDALTLRISPRTLKALNMPKLLFTKLLPQSLILYDKHCISTRNCGLKCFGLTCDCCRSSFFIFIDHSGFTLGMPQTVQTIDRPMHIENFIHNDSDNFELLPAVLKKFVFVVPSKQEQVEWESEEIMEYDIDEDIMFSPTTLDCVVGSYEDKPMLFFDGTN